MISPIDSATESLLEALFSDPPTPVPCERAEFGLVRVGTAVVGAADGAIVFGFGAAVGPLVGSLAPPGILPEPLSGLLSGSLLVVPLDVDGIDVDGIPVTGEAVGTAVSRTASSNITGRSMIGAEVVGANVVDGEDIMYAPLSMSLEWSTLWV